MGEADRSVTVRIPRSRPRRPADRPALLDRACAGDLAVPVQARRAQVALQR